MSELLGNLFIGNGELLQPSEFHRFKEKSESQPSVYEVIRVEEGIPLFYEDYMERLKNSFALLGQEMPLGPKEIYGEVKRLIEATQYRSGPVKLVFGTGNASFYMAFLMKAHIPTPEEYITGVKTVLMREMRPNPNLKMWNKGLRDRSVELLNRTNAYEALLVNTRGLITEASRSNVFFIKGDEVFTTDEKLILPGITRGKVLEVCQEHGIVVNFTNLPADEIGTYDSCFLTGTARKIVPVRAVDDILFHVETEMLKRIADYFEAFVNRYLSKY